MHVRRLITPCVGPQDRFILIQLQDNSITRPTVLFQIKAARGVNVSKTILTVVKSSHEPITMISILMRHKRIVYIQALSVVIFSLIPHDSEPVIFSTVKLELSLINSYCPSLLSKLNEVRALKNEVNHTFINAFSIVCYHSGVIEKRSENLQFVTLPLWQHHGGGGDGAGMGVRCRVCSNCCLLGRRSERGRRVRLAGWSAAHPKHFSLKTVSRNTTHWQPAGIYQPDSPCICEERKKKKKKTFVIHNNRTESECK